MKQKFAINSRVLMIAMVVVLLGVLLWLEFTRYGLNDLARKCQRLESDTIELKTEVNNIQMERELLIIQVNQAKDPINAEMQRPHSSSFINAISGMDGNLSAQMRRLDALKARVDNVLASVNERLKILRETGKCPTLDGKLNSTNVALSLLYLLLSILLFFAGLMFGSHTKSTTIRPQDIKR